MYPLVSKTVHIHHGELTCFEFSNHQSYNHTTEICPIYNFEFFNFVATEHLTSLTYLKSIRAYNSPEKHLCFVPVVSYFSLRAPPAA
jgi:hypothetical protein